MQEIAQRLGAHQTRVRNIYTELRRNVIATVYRSWRTTGYAWEQYNPVTGAGQRTRHFTGWTALVVKIMAFPELEKPKRPRLTSLGVSGVAGSILSSFTFILPMSLLALLHLNRHRIRGVGAWLRR
jgi:mannosyl-oligosaccharide glucosidase